MSPDESTEFCFDGPTLVEWPLRFYGPTCTVCGVRFCGTHGTTCLGCTPWKDAPVTDSVELEYPPLSLRTRAWHRAYVAWYDHREAGHSVRAALWGGIADALIRGA